MFFFTKSSAFVEMILKQAIIFELAWIIGVASLTCQCDYYCPDNHKNFTCETDYKCFATFGFMEDGSLTKVRRHGCMPSEHSGGMFQCRGTAWHQIPISVLCCDDENMCNLNLDPTYLVLRKKCI